MSESHQMSTARLKVLELLSQGRISVDDTEALLSFLAQLPPQAKGSAEVLTALDLLSQDKVTVGELVALLETFRTSDTPAVVTEKDPSSFEFLRVEVADGDDIVDLKVPLKLVRLGVSIPKVLPDPAKEVMREQGVDLGELQSLSEEEFVDAISGLSIDIQSGSDEKVRVFCE